MKAVGLHSVISSLFRRQKNVLEYFTSRKQTTDRLH